MEEREDELCDFPDHIVGASLRVRPAGVLRGGGSDFPDHIVGASLRAPHETPVVDEGDYFPDHIVGASLRDPGIADDHHAIAISPTV